MICSLLTLIKNEKMNFDTTSWSINRNLVSFLSDGNYDKRSSCKSSIKVRLHSAVLGYVRFTSEWYQVKRISFLFLFWVSCEEKF